MVFEPLKGGPVLWYGCQTQFVSHITVDGGTLEPALCVVEL